MRRRSRLAHGSPAPYVSVMQLRPAKLLMIAASVALVLGALDRADAAKRKKPRAKRPPAPAVTYDRDGTPIIMQGYRVPRPDMGIPSIMRDEPGTRPSRPIAVPRGSSTYVPPPVPSP